MVQCITLAIFLKINVIGYIVLSYGYIILSYLTVLEMVTYILVQFYWTYNIPTWTVLLFLTIFCFKLLCVLMFKFLGALVCLTSWTTEIFCYNWNYVIQAINTHSCFLLDEAWQTLFPIINLSGLTNMGWCMSNCWVFTKCSAIITHSGF